MFIECDYSSLLTECRSQSCSLLHGDSKLVVLSLVFDMATSTLKCAIMMHANLIKFPQYFEIFFHHSNKIYEMFSAMVGMRMNEQSRKLL